MKLSKRIRGKENYYMEMIEGDELHIYDKDNNIKISLTMKKEGLYKWNNDHTI